MSVVYGAIHASAWNSHFPTPSSAYSGERLELSLRLLVCALRCNLLATQLDSYPYKTGAVGVATPSGNLYLSRELYVIPTNTCKSL